MIVPMQKAAIILMEKDAESALEKLRQLGVLHLEHQHIPKSAEINEIQNSIISGTTREGHSPTFLKSLRMWEIHMHMMYGTYTPYVLFEQLCMQMLNIDDTHPTFHKMVSGFDNESFRVDRRLWEFSKKVRDMVLLQVKPMTPEDAAKPVLFLASDDSSYITGENILINGGR